MRHKKPIIGLSGGIGAGKSSVAREFERLGCFVASDDELSHEVMSQPEVLATLRSWWGEAVVDSAGQADRERIAGIVFSDPPERQRLEGLLHPLIRKRRADMIKAVENSSAIKAIVIDSPLLYESNLDRDCDTVVFVDAGAAERSERLRQSRGWDAEELQRRERWQISPADKRGRSEFGVDNNGDAHRLGPQVADILEAILRRFSSPR